MGLIAELRRRNVFRMAGLYLVGAWLVEQMLAQDREQRRRQWWLRSAWLPSTRALREDPRFFAIVDELGIAKLWQVRGWPDGCTHVEAAGGDQLDCAR